MEAHLYAKGYLLKHNANINNIVLPNCPNIHLFAITFVQ